MTRYKISSTKNPLKLFTGISLWTPDREDDRIRISYCIYEQRHLEYNVGLEASRVREP